jgi:hypothetical protein
MQSSQNLSSLVPLRPKYLPTEITLYSINDVIDCLKSHIHKGKGKVHPCIGTKALYRPYDP